MPEYHNSALPPNMSTIEMALLTAASIEQNLGATMDRFFTRCCDGPAADDERQLTNAPFPMVLGFREFEALVPHLRIARETTSDPLLIALLDDMIAVWDNIDVLRPGGQG